MGLLWNQTQLDISAASQQGKAELIRALVESGRARATDRDDDRVAPVHWAVINDRLEACTYLIEQGADVNAIGKNRSLRHCSGLRGTAW
ncbi:hypothetical protein V8E52_004405 [Russula decolorans]|jgi:ankyrin repeat protein